MTAALATEVEFAGRLRIAAGRIARDGLGQKRVDGMTPSRMTALAVLAPDGSVVPEATVTASDARGDIVGSTCSDVDGRYRLADLPPGRYLVVATTYAPAAVQVEVPAGEAARVDLRLGTLTRAES